MPYVTQSEVETRIPPVLLVDALDDDKDGEADEGKLDQIIAAAAQEVDGYLASRYVVPFPDPAPAQVRAAALVFVFEALYDRRPVGDKNPWKKKADDWRVQLKAIGDGKGAIDTTSTQAQVLVAGYGGATVVPGRIPAP
jgi:phage gp36-like protein